MPVFVPLLVPLFVPALFLHFSCIKVYVRIGNIPQTDRFAGYLYLFMMIRHFLEEVCDMSKLQFSASAVRHAVQRLMDKEGAHYPIRKWQRGVTDPPA